MSVELKERPAENITETKGKGRRWLLPCLCLLLIASISLNIWLYSNIYSQEGQLSAIQSDIATATTTIEEMGSELEQLENELEGLEATYNNQLEQIATLEAELGELQEELATKEKELAELRGEELSPIEGGADQSGAAGGDGGDDSLTEDTTGTSSTSGGNGTGDYIPEGGLVLPGGTTDPGQEHRGEGTGGGGGSRGVQ